MDAAGEGRLRNVEFLGSLVERIAGGNRDGVFYLLQSHGLYIMSIFPIISIGIVWYKFSTNSNPGFLIFRKQFGNISHTQKE
jgi:hypothetical protein